MDEAFKTFFSHVVETEHLFWCRDDERLSSLNPKGVSYGWNEKAQLRLADFKQLDSGVTFTVHWNGKVYKDIFLALFGHHNALNAAAVFGMALSLGVSGVAIRSALAKFGGTARRGEV